MALTAAQKVRASAALAGGAGGDAWGPWLRDKLDGAGVDLTWFRLMEGHHTPVAFVAVDAEGVAGYVVGTADSRAFEAKLEADWYPALRERYPDGSGDGFDAMLVALLHHPMRADDAVVASHPAHLHIDLLPRLQGTGMGPRLMATMHDACRAAGARGMHLGVSQRNSRALGFYRHLGYVTLHEDPITVTMGLAL